ncbi:patatin-like phospholipase family protein [Oscillospiraceae bacterium PP1C4]
MKSMSFGIALAGGGTMGAAHVGVLLALEEAGIYPRSVAGTSAGSFVAGLYAAGNSAVKLKEIVIRLSKTGPYYMDADLSNLAKAVPKFIINHEFDISGLIKGNRLEQLLYQLTSGKSMEEINMRTIIPAVDINTGDTIAYTNSLNNVRPLDSVKWKTDALISEAIRASCAIPAIFQPKLIGDMCLVDGSVTDVLPIDLLLASGEQLILAVDIAQSYESPKKKNIIDISTSSLSIMSARLKKCHLHGEALLLKPKIPEEAGLLTFQYMVECMNAGYEAAQANLPAIKAIFG